MLSRFQFSIRHFSASLSPPDPSAGAVAASPTSTAQRRLAPPPAPVSWLTAALALASVVTAVRAYPYYIPFLNSLGDGRPSYFLVADSNLDWNQGLPDVENFMRQRGLTHALIDSYGFSDPTVYVPQATLWNCQKAVPQDGGNWAFSSRST